MLLRHCRPQGAKNFCSRSSLLPSNYQLLTQTTPIPFKFDRQGHSCNLFVGFGPTDKFIERILRLSFIFAGGHTVSNAPDLFRPPMRKRHRARLVLGWGTAWEPPGVLPFTHSCHKLQISPNRTSPWSLLAF